ncbi:hypothetical protein DL93DRAFT_2227086 [Clavulina sp. PMI_390]|nr:hypothetical protein DL93DRAFT_2227086 [Clavulina sp. PMI_390]
MSNAELAAALAIQSEVDQARRFLAAGTAILAYDHALSFPDEVQHIWSSKRSHSLVVWLFLLNRYGAPLIMFSFVVTTSGAFAIGPKPRSMSGVPVLKSHVVLRGYSCQANIFGGSILVAFLVIVWDSLIALRAYSLYNRRPEIGWFLATTLCLSSSATLVIGIWHMLEIIPNVVTIQDIRVCTTGSTLPTTYWALWVPGCLQETLIFTLTARKLLQREQLNMSGLRTLLFRDGFLYYCGLMAWRVTGIVIFTQRHPSVVFETTFCFVGIGATLVSRLFLNLRSFGQLSDIDEFGSSTTDARWTTRIASSGCRFGSNSSAGRGNAHEQFNMHDLLPSVSNPQQELLQSHHRPMKSNGASSQIGTAATQLSQAISTGAVSSQNGVRVYFTPRES